MSKNLPKIFTSSPRHRKHLVFGANTDVGKTVVCAGLLRSSLFQHPIANYIKPLQCGGSDGNFVKNHIGGDQFRFRSKVLHSWDIPASPHLASRLEGAPLEDSSLLKSLTKTLEDMITESDLAAQVEGTKEKRVTTLIETAGGVLSPGPSSPLNTSSHHSRYISGKGDSSSALSWGWSTQADLYSSLGLPALLVGDGRLGGISATLSSFESLLIRGYDVHGVVLINDSDNDSGIDNASALREYFSRRADIIPGKMSTVNLPFFEDPKSSIISFPSLPPEPVPLDGWYNETEVKSKFDLLLKVLDEASKK